MSNGIARRVPVNRSGFIAPKVGTTAPKVKTGLTRFADVVSAVNALRPAQPLHCLHPDALAQAATMFLQHFPGDAYYAVKSNPDPYVLTQLYNAGIRHFDVASLGEVQLLRGLFTDAKLAFMHPVIGRETIRTAYFDYGVRNFVLDTAEELRKICEETKNATDLTLIVRLARPKGSAACPLTSKFGATPELTVELLRAAAKVAQRVGLSFHVGSQSLDPSSYADAIRLGGEVVKQAGIPIGVFDIGGGFPVPGMGMEVPPLTAFFDVIREELKKIDLPAGCEVWSEPGRALSGTCETLVVRVELRKDDALYINDGSFGSMFEVCSMNWRNNVQLLRFNGKTQKTSEAPLKGFRFWGPTCDSVDYMAGPFMLPEDIREGDYIAINSMGAYMAASQSRFNGFYSDLQVEIQKPTGAKLVRLRPKR